MTFASKIAIAAVLVAAAGSSALAQDWRYYDGPRGYAYVDDGWRGAYAYGGTPYYGGPYAYAGEPYYYGRTYGPRYRYRYAPATSDYYHDSRQLQGTR